MNLVVKITHALVGQVLAGVFVELGLSASVLTDRVWHPIHIPVVFRHSEIVADVVIFERVHGMEAKRATYNDRSVRQVRRARKTLLTQHAGFHDLFVPIGGAGASLGILVTGPFTLARPTSADLRARWRWLTGRSARASDPEFARYLATTLATTTFEGSQLESFRQLMECFARVLAGQGQAEKLAREAETLQEQLRDNRFVERMWTVARHMIDEGVWRSWQGPDQAGELAKMGLRRFPQRAMVGLLAPRDLEADPIDDLLRRDAFQRACVGLLKGRGGAIGGPIGDHGVMLLVDESGSARANTRLSDLGQRITALANEHGFRLHLGVSGPGTSPLVLPRRYQAALAAAERAFSQGASVLFADDRVRIPADNALGDLRRQLLRAVGEDPTLLAPRFERYLESVRVQCGYRVEPTRAHLEIGLEQVLEVLKAGGALGDRACSELRSTLEETSRQAATVSELSVAYQRALADVERALRRPREARQDQGIRRAVAYMRDHFDEPLSLARVARIAGFAPSYFSKLFAQNERVTFREYTQRLRIERAKRMLVSTKLSAERIGHLSGFRTRQRFHVIFRQLERVTPQQYRVRAAQARDR